MSFSSLCTDLYYHSKKQTYKIFFCKHRLNGAKWSALTAEGEFSQPVPSHRSLIFSNTFLLILSIITWTVKLSRSCQFLLHHPFPNGQRRSKLGTRSSYQCPPHGYRQSSWHICQGPPRVLQNSSPLEEGKEGRGSSEVLIHSFNMLICLGLLQSLPSWTLQKETVFQRGDVFFKHLKQKTNESKYQVHSAVWKRLVKQKQPG